MNKTTATLIPISSDTTPKKVAAKMPVKLAPKVPKFVPVTKRDPATQLPVIKLTPKPAKTNTAAASSYSSNFVSYLSLVDCWSRSESEYNPQFFKHREVNSLTERNQQSYSTKVNINSCIPPFL